MGRPFTRIMVIEPRGMMFLKTTRVEINLLEGVGDYNFVLNTGSSNVKFEHDPLVPSMRINRLVVRGTGHVSLPPPPFNLTVGELVVDSHNASLDCRAPIGDVTIRGNSRNITLGNIRGMQVDGGAHHVYLNNATHDIGWRASHGSLSIYQRHEEDLVVESTHINLDVRDTRSIDLTTYDGVVNIDRVRTTSKVFMEKGHLRLGARTVNNNGNGVYGDVEVEKRFGGVTVNFASYSSASGTCKIRAVDDAVEVYGARWHVDIIISSAGRNAGVTAWFAGFPPSGTSQIIIHGSRIFDVAGNINVYMMGGTFASRVNVTSAGYAWDHVRNRELVRNQTYQIHGITGGALLNLSTFNSVNIYP